MVHSIETISPVGSTGAAGARTVAGMWSGLAFSWGIRSYRKAATRREWWLALAVFLPLFGLTAVAGFQTGQNEQYPAAARRLIAQLQNHAREVKRIKAEISGERSQFTTPVGACADSNIYSKTRKNLPTLRAAEKHGGGLYGQSCAP
jgi:hypothetical protein